MNGTKTLTGATSIGSGVCGAFAFGGTEAEAVDLQTGVRYTAEITTPSGSDDSGDSVVSYDETSARRGRPGNGFSFTESFASTSSAVCVEDNDDEGDESARREKGEDEG